MPEQYETDLIAILDGGEELLAIQQTDFVEPRGADRQGRVVQRDQDVPARRLAQQRGKPPEFLPRDTP
jgi:hypothetical protein